jgi:hypothetical protein
MKKLWRLRRAEGQSLVEMALTLPVLILMFAGLVEVGAALRDYLIVVNANREGTRFAARGRWFGSQEDVQHIFERIVAAAGTEQRGERSVPFLRALDLGDLGESNATVAIHYIEVPPQWDRDGNKQIRSPVVNGPWYTGTLHLGASQVNVATVAEEARQANEEFNAKYFADPDTQILDIPSADDFVIVEVWYEHEQLLKLPVFTKILPEKFTLYAQSTMRVTLDSRVE